MPEKPQSFSIISLSTDASCITRAEEIQDPGNLPNTNKANFGFCITEPVFVQSNWEFLTTVFTGVMTAMLKISNASGHIVKKSKGALGGTDTALCTQKSTVNLSLHECQG